MSQFFCIFLLHLPDAMDMKNFSNTILLLKVDKFEGFSNWSNVDELVINSTSGCNCKNYKLIIKIINLTIT